MQEKILLDATLTKEKVIEESDLELSVYRIEKLPGFIFVRFDYSENADIYLLYEKNYSNVIENVKKEVYERHSNLFKGL